MRAQPWQRKANSLPSSRGTETPRDHAVNRRMEADSRRRSAVVHVFAPSAHVQFHDANGRARLHTEVGTASAGSRAFQMSHFKNLNQGRFTRSQLTLSNAI